MQLPTVHYRAPSTQPPAPSLQPISLPPAPSLPGNSSSTASSPVNSSRFHELLEALRHEHEQTLGERMPNADNELKLQSLFNEFVMMQKMVRELEGNYSKLKRKMDDQNSNAACGSGIEVAAPNIDSEVQQTFTSINAVTGVTKDNSIKNSHINNCNTREVQSCNASSAGSGGSVGEDWKVQCPSGELSVTLGQTFRTESVVCGAAFSPDGKRLALAVNRCCVVIDLESQRQRVFTDFFDADPNADLYMRAVSFSSDGQYLAAGGEDHFVRVWNLESGKIKHRLAGHTQDVYAIRFARDGKRLFSASGDRTVRMWDAMRGECLRTFTNSNHAISGASGDSGFTGLALSASGKYFATVKL